MGSQKPLLALGCLKTLDKLDVAWKNHNAVCLATLLGALSALYVVSVVFW